MDKPTEDRRIDNLRRIAADDTVNNFARSICGEAADTIKALRRQVAELGQLANDHAMSYAKAQERALIAEAERDALLEWENRCAVALGVPGCHPEEMLHVIDSLREELQAIHDELERERR